MHFRSPTTTTTAKATTTATTTTTVTATATTTATATATTTTTTATATATTTATTTRFTSGRNTPLYIRPNANWQEVLAAELGVDVGYLLLGNADNLEGLGIPV